MPLPSRTFACMLVHTVARSCLLVIYANPNRASKKFVQKYVSDNLGIFAAPADMKKLTAPDVVSQDIRRVQTRIFTGFKAAAK